MSRRIAAARLAALAGLVCAVPGTPATADDELNVRVTFVVFSGGLTIRTAAPGVDGYVIADASSCHVRGVYVAGGRMFDAPCAFTFRTGSGPRKTETGCDGKWTHLSKLTFVEPVFGQPIEIAYEPTLSTLERDIGGGVGDNVLGLGKVFFSMAVECPALAGEQSQGTISGHATAPY